ncbi:MAG: hypothetical protein RIS29_1259 [Bacteroidota bacterium]|jgi:predicted aspartyl protease
MRKVLLFVLCLLFCIENQLSGKSKFLASIPFEAVGSYVVIRVKINDSSPLNLILDSGIRNTIITELQEGDHISLNYSDVKDLMGLGANSENKMEAYTSNFNTLYSGKIKLENKQVLVLKEDLFNLSKHTGTKINGLIGMDLLKDYIVEVNYSQKRLNFYNRSSFVCPKGYEQLPLDVELQKVFIQLQVRQRGDSISKPVKMLIDTGAELNAWFQTYKPNSIHKPSVSLRGTIGQGLNGEISGYIGRLEQLCFGSFCLNHPVVSFPDSLSISEIVGNSDRDGTIGSQILSRFNYIIDCEGKAFYFKPNYNFKNSFFYNVAGIEIMQIFPNLPQTEVWKVWKDSPADMAGVQVGDVIVEVNGQNSFELNMNEIKGYFQRTDGHRLRIKVMREKQELIFDLDMKSLI